MTMVPPSAFPQFRALYAVSDLHLGGPPGFQIFDTGQQFARFVDHVIAVAGDDGDHDVALLVNGDLVDFLAERPFVHFDPAGAVDKLNRIAADPAFWPVWDALKRLVRTSGCHLILNLGNHDLELALPWVREQLLQILCDADDAARGRVTLAFDGAGVKCRVESATVLAVHGNEVDDWNLTDHERLRRIGRDVVQGIPVAGWLPNAGARLVIEVMNNVKAQFPFVDLLKPEVEAVIPALLAVAPSQAAKVADLRRVVGRLWVDRIRRRVGLLGGETETEAASNATSQYAVAHDPGTTDRALRRSRDRYSSPVGDEQYAQALLDDADARLHEKVEPLALVDTDARGEYLGARAALAQAARGKQASEVLRAALDGLLKDRSFDHRARDAQFDALDERVGDVDFLIAGHTHLERCLSRRRGRGVYYNSGTWVRLIQLAPAVLANDQAFAGVFNAFRAGTMAALDAQPGLIARPCGVVVVEALNGKVAAELRHADMTGATFRLTPVPNTRVEV